MRIVIGVIRAKILILKFVLAASLVAMLWLPSVASACSCPERSLREYYREADVVFTATIVDSGTTDKMERKDRRVSFAIVNSFKGTPPFSEMQTSWTSCGVIFNEAETYLIFADEKGFVSTCTGTRKLRTNRGMPTKAVTWVEQIEEYLAEGGDLSVPWLAKSGRNSCTLVGDLSSDTATVGISDMVVEFSADAQSSKSSGYITLKFSTAAEIESSALGHAILTLGQTSTQIEISGHHASRIKGSLSKDSILEIAGGLNEIGQGIINGSVSIGSESVAIKVFRERGDLQQISVFESCVKAR